MKKIFMKTRKYLLIFLAGLITLILLGLFILHLKSPGKAELFVNANGEPIKNSISTIEKIELGGIEQYLIIRGIDSTKPVLLFLHGGPGSPEIGYIKKYNPDLEKDFVVVHWEQRGAGMSYSKTIPIESMNIEQFVSDTKELSDYLITRFEKEKLYIMGHSWGSYLGVQTIKKHPELYHCYFGIGQVADQYRSEKISFDWVKEQAEKNKDNRAINKLSKLNFPKKEDDSKKWMNFLLPERNYVDQYGGGMSRDYEGLLNKVSPVLNAKEYTLSDKINYGKGALFSIEHLWSDVMTTNFSESIDSIQTPVYIFQGLHDYQTSYIVAKDFYEQLKAPKKAFFTFENSAHCPFCDEPEKFNKKIRKIIK